jgi:hypothetical protein
MSGANSPSMHRPLRREVQLAGVGCVRVDQGVGGAIAAWTAEQLDRIGAAQELGIAPRRADGSLRPPLPIWVVRVGDDLYVRSWLGSDASWYRAARRTREARICAGGVETDVALEDANERLGNAIDAAYREKYGSQTDYVEAMVAPAARATTLKLTPRAR